MPLLLPLPMYERWKYHPFGDLERQRKSREIPNPCTNDTPIDHHEDEGPNGG
jgi:hypothetical protein